jgi:hypothetical protein
LIAIFQFWRRPTRRGAARRGAARPIKAFSRQNDER